MSLPRARSLLSAGLLAAALTCVGAPHAAASDAAVSALGAGVQVKRATAGAHVVDLATGEVIFSQNDTPLVPASTAKIFTAAAALDALGPDWRFTTALKTDGAVRADGALAGNLYVVGGGDPTLVVEKLWKMVYDLKLRGVTSVSGDVILDDSYMDGEHAIRGWSRDSERGPTYFAPVGALSLNFNAAAVVVGPGAAVGKPGRVLLETPAMKVVTVTNKTTTAKAGTRPSLVLSRKVDGDRVAFTVSGKIPQGMEPETYYRTVADPTSYFTAVFAEMMKLHGIKLSGHYLEGVAPEDARSLIQLKSPPLATILMEMNKSSSNFFAEQVFKAAGAEIYGSPGSADKGAMVVDEYLAGLGISSDEHAVINGSGLSTDWQVRPSHVNAVLADMADDPRVGAEFVASLAIGGRDGTLRKRFTEDEYDIRVRGKTGSLSGVSCLAGYADGGDGRRYAFTVLVNDLAGSSAAAKAAQDKLVEALLDLPSAEMDDPSIRVAGGSP